MGIFQIGREDKRCSTIFSLQEAVDVMLHEDGWMQGNNFDKNTFLSYGRANNYFVLNNAGFRTDFIDDELCKKTIEV